MKPDFSNYSYTVLDRFLRYVTIDTQSDPNSSTYPSTEKQKNLGRLLVQELQAMGLNDAHLDEYGYVYATLPSTSPKKNVPVIFFCAHMDTSPDCSGTDVRPIVHKNYQGGVLELPNGGVRISPEEHPELKNQTGNDIVTADGRTLLGADNKAGVAEIMDAVHFLVTHPDIPHGTVRILFTPDEEIGRGVDKVDLRKLDAVAGYTVDGETLGHLENETFSADMVTVVIRGFPTHPGFAKGKMEHAMKAAAQIIASLPKEYAPEHTEKKEPFLHPVSVQGNVEEVKMQFIVRAFENETLLHLEECLRNIIVKVLSEYPKCSYHFEVKEQYRNMKEVLDKHPHITEYALQAIERSGVKPVLSSIRGGTDGSRLTFMGLPCPNLFAGEHAFHSTQEWVSVQDMQKAVQTIVHLCCIWEEKA
jgi:tripeptide aminopeptidase